ncbi:CsbD family protein [Nocardioides dilutus]
MRGGPFGNRSGMGFDDKAENQGTDIKGRAKEAAGSLTGDDELKSEGRADQAEASVKKAGEKAKDAIGDVKDAFKK